MQVATYIENELIDKVRALGAKVGHTPLHRITHLPVKSGVSIYAKKEWEQLSGSVKARAAYSIFRAAIEQGHLTRDKILLDATSGNTGIAYATIGKMLNIKVSLCLPENASQERKDILRSLGAEIIFTSKFEGTDGSQQKARQLATDYPERYFYADQYKNDNNWKAHYFTTGPEIIDELPGITHFVAGLGTTGTFVGTGRRLKEWKPSVRLISLQPDTALHGLEGWKHMETAIVPRIYDPKVANEEEWISTEETYRVLKDAHRHEGLLLSPSSAANLAGALRVAERTDKGVIVTVFPDNADKYSEVIKKLI
ncbi:MAG TPA: cysteine synthase family protein [Chitinophagaceae bacterium]|nr:cysteine synthase family protein [Chitinophagaceae bacterium]